MASEHTSAERAALVAELVVNIAQTCAASFAKALTQKSAGLPECVIPKITLEVCSLYTHLLDRNAFASLSTDKRELANRTLLETIACELSTISRHETCSELLQLFRADSRYSKFLELLPRPGTSPRDTLFWEFGKDMAFKYEGLNPVGLQVFTIAVADGYIKIIETIGELSRL